MQHDILTPGEHRRRLWDSLPNNMFIDLANLESFREGHTSFLLKLCNSIPSMKLDHQRIGELPFGALSLITCGGLPIAYSLKAPTCSVNSGRNYVALLLRNKPPAEMRRIFVDGKLVIIGDDTALVVVVSNAQRRWLK